MSPQLIEKMLNQNWFLSSQMKEMSRTNSPVFELDRMFKLLNGLKNAAAKFIRRTCHNNKHLLTILIYCLIICNNCIKLANGDDQPHAADEDDDEINDNMIKDLNAQKHLPPIHNPDVISTAEANNKSNAGTLLGDVSFLHAFVETLSMILFSELGDKTFFIAAIMAMRHSRMIVFTGAIAALILMTVLSSKFVLSINEKKNSTNKTYSIFHFVAGFGKLANFIPRVYTYYISTALFAIFGLKMIRDGYYMSPTDAQEELEEVQADLKKREDEVSGEHFASVQNFLARQFEGIIR